ncbi:signal peptidase I [Streptomyces sp. NPDC058534]|uniref:signal peptidase I n=1 Tax=Streptomyces sp. NPDC058534 TaxID=3346541 RepID=UPI003649EDD8
MRQRSEGRGLSVAGWVLVPVGLVLLLGGIGYDGGLADEQVTITGDAMQPTYRPGQRLAIERIDEDEIGRGDVVLVRVPGRYGGAPVVQRVIGLGGDHVESRDGARVAVNGRQIDEPYVMRDKFGRAGAQYDVTVPEGRLFLLGDHRASANDSRYFLSEQSGSVAASDVRGRVREVPALPWVMLAVGVFGALLTLVGTGLGIGGYVTGRRSRRAGAAVPSWPVDY